MELRRSERALLGVLRDRSGQAISDAELAMLTDYSVDSVRKARRRLRDLGLIAFTSGTGHVATTYQVMESGRPQ